MAFRPIRLQADHRYDRPALMKKVGVHRQEAAEKYDRLAKVQAVECLSF